MVFEKIKEIISSQLGIEKTLITPQTNIVDDLGADSLDIVELMTTLEDEFGLVIADDSIRELKTVKDIVNVVENILEKI